MKSFVATTLLPLLLLASCNGEAGTSVPAESEVGARVVALLGDSKFDEVVALLQADFDAGELDSEAARQLALARTGQNELPKAIHVLKTALKADPGEVTMSLDLSRIYSAIGQHKLAFSVLTEAREKGASDLQLALTMGMAKGRLDDLDGAEAEFLRARAAGAPAADVDYNLSLVHRQRGELAEARVLLEGVAKLAPERMSVQRELGIVILQLDPEAVQEVREIAERVLAENDEDWRAWELLGDAEFHAKDYMAAQTYYTSALEFGSKQIGNNPPRVEEKYLRAATLNKQELIEQGVIPEDAGIRKGAAPPIPASVLERQRELQRARDAAEEASEGAEAEDSGGD